MFDPKRRRTSSTRLTVTVALALALVAVAMAVAPVHVLASTTFVVNRIGDAPDNNLADSKCDTSAASGKQCTLRAAIREANDTPGVDTINFNISSASKVITPATPLPAITDTVTIDGYSQSGAKANTLAIGSDAVLKIVLDGVNAGVGANGLDVTGSNTIIRGLVIQRFAGSGVVVGGTNGSIFGNYIGTNVAGTTARGNGVGVTVTGSLNSIGKKLAERNVISGNETRGVLVEGIGANANRVAGNYIGTAKSGASALGNGTDGVEIGEPLNVVGSPSVSGRNVISGNGAAGVNISDTSAANNGTILGNYIGTDATGSIDLGNGGAGILVVTGVLTIGGISAGARNVISGNGSHGIFIFGSGDNNVVQGNYIGTNAAGTAALGNDGDGIHASTSNGTVIGGTSAGARNVISANGHDGVFLFSNTGQVIQGNRIGTKADGTGDLGNGGDGVYIFADNNTIGGTAGAASNLISGNGGEGVYVEITATGNQVRGNVISANDQAGIQTFGNNTTIGAGNLIVANGDDGIQVKSLTTGVRITGNRIYANDGLGIDLEGGTEDSAGVTANDSGDPDTGANNLQNFPVLTSANFNVVTGVTTIGVSLSSDASTAFTVELFVVAGADPSGHGEANVFLASQNVTTNASGGKSFTFLVGALPPGIVLTATATSTTAGNTSEFSANRTVN